MIKPLTDEELEFWRARAAEHDDSEEIAVRLIATVDEKERQRAAAVARRASESELHKEALRNLLATFEKHAPPGSYQAVFEARRVLGGGTTQCNHPPMHWNGPIQPCPRCGASVPAPCESSGEFQKKIDETLRGGR